MDEPKVMRRESTCCDAPTPEPGAEICFWCDKPGTLRWDKDRESYVHKGCAEYLRERGREVRLGVIGSTGRPLPPPPRHNKTPPLKKQYRT